MLLVGSAPRPGPGWRGSAKNRLSRGSKLERRPAAAMWQQQGWWPAAGNGQKWRSGAASTIVAAAGSEHMAERLQLERSWAALMVAPWRQHLQTHT
jgi:hypothetical protein